MAEAVVVAEDPLVHLFLHQRPVEQDIVVQRKEVIEAAEECAAGRVLLRRDIVGSIRMPLGDGCHKGIFDGSCVVPEPPCERLRRRAIDLDHPRGVLQMLDHHLEVLGAKRLEELLNVRNGTEVRILI